MKKSIGIRVAPDCVYYALIQEEIDRYTIISIDKVKCPRSLYFPEQLKLIRTTLLDIINENKITCACIRETENVARKTSDVRIAIEGVIQELLASSEINKYKVIQIQQMTSLLNLKKGEAKLIIEGKQDYDVVENFCNYKGVEKESIISALCALKL